MAIGSGSVDKEAKPISSATIHTTGGDEVTYSDFAGEHLLLFSLSARRTMRDR